MTIILWSINFFNQIFHSKQSLDSEEYIMTIQYILECIVLSQLIPPCHVCIHQKYCSKQEIELFKQEMELFPFPVWIILFPVCHSRYIKHSCKGLPQSYSNHRSGRTYITSSYILYLILYLIWICLIFYMEGYSNLGLASLMVIARLKQTLATVHLYTGSTNRK